MTGLVGGDRGSNEARRRSGGRGDQRGGRRRPAATSRSSIEDDVCDPKQAVAVANLIVGQQIKFVDGHACSGSSIPASDVYADNKVLMMSPASTNPTLTEKGYPTIMRLTSRATTRRAPSSRRGSPRISRARRSPSCTTSAPTAKAWRRSSRRRSTSLGVQEVMFEGINPGEKDYSAHRQQAEGGRRRIRLLRRLSHRSRPDRAPGGRPGLQVPVDERRRARDRRVLADRRPGGRGNAVHLRRRSAPVARRRQGDGAVQGAGLQSGRLHPVLLRRRSGDRRGDQARRLRTIRSRSRKALENGQPVDTRARPDQSSTPRATSRIRTSTSTSGTTASTPRSPSKRRAAWARRCRTAARRRDGMKLTGGVRREAWPRRPKRGRRSRRRPRALPSRAAPAKRRPASPPTACRLIFGLSLRWRAGADLRQGAGEPAVVTDR